MAIASRATFRDSNGTLAVQTAKQQLLSTNLTEVQHVLLDELFTAVNQQIVDVIERGQRENRLLCNRSIQVLENRDAELREAEVRLTELDGNLQKMTLTNTAAMQSKDQEIQALKNELKKKETALKAAEDKNNQLSRTQVDLKKECDKLRMCFEIAIQKPKPLAFGPESWEMFIGVVDPATSLPKNICDTLEANDPWDTTKKVRDTHLLFWRPMTINGLPITLQTIETAFKSPKCGMRPHIGYNRTPNPPHNTKQEFINRLNDTWDKVHTPGWVLLRKEAVPETANELYSKQSQIVLEKKGYNIPTIIEVVFGIFIEQMRGNPIPFAPLGTRCLPTGLTDTPEVPGTEWLVHGDPLTCFKIPASPPNHSFVTATNTGMGAVIRLTGGDSSPHACVIQ